jgi:hypothetical protein
MARWSVTYERGDAALTARRERSFTVFRGLGRGSGSNSRALALSFLASAGILTLASCSSPSAPTQSPGAYLTLSGVTVLTPGLTSQLTATSSSGAVVSAGLTWQSQATTVATVSQTGLVTGTGVGTTTVTASASGATGRVSIVVQAAGTTTTTISACQTITSPGSYTLSGDLAPAPVFGPCLLLSGVASVQIDCRGHVVPGIHLSNVNLVTVSNCVVTSSQNSSGFYLPVNLNNVNNVTVTNCTVTAVAGTAINLVGGTNNQVLQSTIVGGYDGSPTENGSDDGVGLNNEAGDTIRGNTISGFYDTAVEGEDAIANLTVASNTFSNIGTAAIGAYWCPNWMNNVIQGNDVSMAPTLARVEYDVGTACGANAPPPVFSGNRFVGNQFRNPTTGVGYPSPMARMRVTMSGSVTGNVLQSNDFGTSDGPFLTPLQGFSDGGGNICGPLNPAVSNFVCTGGASASGRASTNLHALFWWPPPAQRVARLNRELGHQSLVMILTR